MHLQVPEKLDKSFLSLFSAGLFRKRKTGTWYVALQILLQNKDPVNKLGWFSAETCTKNLLKIRLKWVENSRNVIKMFPVIPNFSCLFTSTKIVNHLINCNYNFLIAKKNLYFYCLYLRIFLEQNFQSLMYTNTVGNGKQFEKKKS